MWNNCREMRLETMVFHLIALVFRTCMHAAAVELPLHYQENMELIQQRAGNDIKLNCRLQNLRDIDKKSEPKVHWYFKQCSDASSSTSKCFKFYEDDDWVQLPCEESLCKSELLLHNITEKYSGLYKCTVHPYVLDDGHTLDILLVRTYQLNVRNAVPEFLDASPSNSTSVAGNRVVLQCRVQSEEYATIKWFRRVPEYSTSNLQRNTYSQMNVNFNARIVRYNGHSYELIPTMRESLLGDGVYLSKLLFNSVRLKDEGFYACVAINSRGHDVREFKLQVFEVDTDYWSDYDNDSHNDPIEFLLLFLMPLGLAVLPIVVWLSYIGYKRCKSQDTKTIVIEQQYAGKETSARQYMLVP